MNFIQQLTQGTPKFTTSEDGSETMELRPPTVKELRAARELEKAMMVNQQMGMSYQQLERAQNEIFAQHEATRQELERITKLVEEMQKTVESFVNPNQQELFTKESNGNV